MIKVAVCDNEEYFREQIKCIILKYMKKLQYHCTIECFDSGENLLKFILQKLDFNIVFLDVNMKKIDGIETAKAIRKLAPNIYIVFVTAHITYALEGYKVDAVRYLLKGDNNFEKAIKECLDAIIDKMNYKEVKFTFEFQGGKMKLAVDRILYIESRLHKVIFFVIEDRITEYYMYNKLDIVEKNLSQFGFYRIHQSFLVNIKYIKSIKRYKAFLVNGMELSISKKYYKDVETKYIKLREGI